MMYFIGIDVGKNKYYLVWFSDEDKEIKRKKFTKPEDICNFLTDKRGVIAIDAPSDLCNSKNDKRQCEVELGIGGYFKTPRRRALAKPWMRSGFELWDFLRKKGHKPIEVHPTVIFKKLLNPEISDPRLWISRKTPISKSKAKGKEQRRTLLKKKFQKQDNVIDKFNIDYIDALIAAYAAEQFYLKKVKSFGNNEEGRIWFPLE